MQRRRTPMNIILLLYYYYTCYYFSLSLSLSLSTSSSSASAALIPPSCSYQRSSAHHHHHYHSKKKKNHNGIGRSRSSNIYTNGSVNLVNITTSASDNHDDDGNRILSSSTYEIGGLQKSDLGRSIWNGKKVVSSSSSSFSKKQAKASLKQLWQRRHAGSINEGIRRTKDDLNQILNESGIHESKSKSQYVARTLTGLIMAFAEEVDGLQVEVESRPETPVWDKHVNNVRIKFRRLGFKPLRMGGFDDFLENTYEDDLEEDDLASDVEKAFQTIDVDNSGSLDQGELATALGMAMGGGNEISITSRGVIPKTILKSLAARLVALYDTNGDKELDREEYKIMVEDMAALRKARRIRKNTQDNKSRRKNLARSIRRRLRNFNPRQVIENTNAVDEEDLFEEISTAITGHEVKNGFAKSGTGSFTFSNLKLDLRQMVFGSVPGVKYITPGGPLVLEPFTLTFKGSFDKNDFMNSFLLDSGLRRLVARALRLRVRSFRDFLDGAMFYGRQWNMASAEAPMVEVPQLTNIEFDKRDRLIITGIAQIRASPDAPTIENSFKLRARIGTRMNGQVIRLQDPEIAILLECPKAWERNIVSVYKKLNIKRPVRPEPITIFTPLIQPAKFQNKDGYNMGEDNNIKSIRIKNGALRIEMSVVIRPGRFLGSHYVAFSIPQRTFIVTKDRVTNGLRQARRNKLTAEELRDADSEVELMKDLNQQYSFKEPTRNGRSKAVDESVNGEASQGNFIAKFLKGYSSAKVGETEMDEWVISDYLKTSISDWFGRQTDEPKVSISMTNSTTIINNGQNDNDDEKPTEAILQEEI